MVLVFTKHKNIIRDKSYKHKKWRYCLSNIKIDKEGYHGGFSGFPGYIDNYYIDNNSIHYIKAYTEICTEIGAAYIAVVNIIKPEIECYMDKNYKIAEIEYNIRYAQDTIKFYKKRISVAQNKIVRLNNEINRYNDIIKKNTEIIKTQEENLITEKMSAL